MRKNWQSFTVDSVKSVDFSPTFSHNIVILQFIFSAQQLFISFWRLRVRTSGWRVIAAFRNEPSFPFPGRRFASHPNKSNTTIYMPKESIKIKWYNWSNCCGPLKSGAGGSLLPEFQPGFEHCENYKCRFKNIFILWVAALMQSLQVKDLLYLYSKSIMKTIKQLGVHEPHVNSVSHLNVLSAMYRLTFILWQNFPRLDASTLLVQAESP